MRLRGDGAWSSEVLANICGFVQRIFVLEWWWCAFSEAVMNSCAVLTTPAYSHERRPDLVLRMLAAVMQVLRLGIWRGNDK